MANNHKLTNEFKTDNLALSAYLLCNSCSIKRIEPAISVINKFFFVFQNTNTVKNLVNKFISYSALVTAQSYYVAVREVKRMMIEYKNNN